MTRTALPSAAAPLMCAALSLPAFAQDDPRSVERRTQELKDAAAPAIVSIIVTPRVDPVPRLAFPGVVIAPTAGRPDRVEGTGFFCAARGFLVTTRELLADAARIEVRFQDGTVRDASVAGIDRPFRLAVLRTSAPDGTTSLPYAAHVEADASTIGWFFSAAPRIDVQIASVRPAPEQGASYDRFLFAPISLARGAAGGPLLGCDGKLLGMAVGSLVAPEGDGDSGAGLRVRTLFVRGDDIAEAVRQIAATGVVERPMIGVTMQDDSNRVDLVLPGSPAEAAGLAEGDAIVGVGAFEVANYADLTRALLRRRVGDKVSLTIDRGGSRITREVVLAVVTRGSPPTTPPIAGTVIEAATNAKGEPTFTFVEVRAGSAAAKAGVAVGDKLISVDGRAAWRFLKRHQIRAAAQQPSKLVVERDGATREIALPTE